MQRAEFRKYSVEDIEAPYIRTRDYTMLNNSNRGFEMLLYYHSPYKEEEKVENITDTVKKAIGEMMADRNPDVDYDIEVVTREDLFMTEVYVKVQDRSFIGKPLPLPKEPNPNDKRYATKRSSAYNSFVVECVKDTKKTIYVSIREAARELHVSPKSIRDVIYGRRPHIKGMVFRKLAEW